MANTRAAAAALFALLAILACGVPLPTTPTALAPLPTELPPLEPTSTVPAAVPTEGAPVPSATSGPLPSATPTPPHGDWPLYTSEACGFTVRYPPDGVVSPGMEGSDRITLTVTPGTNLVDKYLEIACRSGVDPCVSPLAAGYGSGLTTATQLINGTTFTVQSASEGAAGNFYSWVAYSTANGSLCASLSFVLHSVNAYNYSPPLTEYNQAAESAVFGEIMSTFAWAGP